MAKKKKTKHEKLVEAATNAIEALNADSSVSIEKTISSLDDLRDHIDVCIEALNEDLSAGRL